MNKEELILEFKHYYKSEPSYYIDTGGRFEIVGNHTDHNHGLCLVANCSLRIKACVNKNSKKVRIKSQGYSYFEFYVDDLEFDPKEQNKTMLLAKGILFKLKELGYKIGGFDEDILGDDIVLRTKIYRYIINNPQYSLYIQRKSGFYYRRHSSNVSKNLSRFLLLLAQYYDRYWNDKPVSKVFKKYFIEYLGSNSESDIISLIKSHSYFIKVLLETPDASKLYYSMISNGKNKGSYNYYTYSIPFFSIKKYKNFITGKKYKEICILGIKFIV